MLYYSDMAPPIARADQVIRERVVTLKMADDEIELIELAAAAQGVSRSEFLRGTAISASAALLVPSAYGAAST
jgi:uncharacterized protein (DUF1778 family)